MPKRPYKLVCTEVARLLRESRVHRGLSMTEVAQRAGLSQQSVSYIEREMRIPNLETLLRITDVLGVELSDLIKSATKSAEK